MHRGCATGSFMLMECTVGSCMLGGLYDRLLIEGNLIGIHSHAFQPCGPWALDCSHHPLVPFWLPWEAASQTQASAHRQLFSLVSTRSILKAFIM